MKAGRKKAIRGVSTVGINSPCDDGMTIECSDVLVQLGVRMILSTPIFGFPISRPNAWYSPRWEYAKPEHRRPYSLNKDPGATADLHMSLIRQCAIKVSNIAHFGRIDLYYVAGVGLCTRTLQWGATEATASLSEQHTCKFNCLKYTISKYKSCCSFVVQHNHSPLFLFAV